MNGSSITTDRFSWRRVAMVARFFYPKLRSQIILFPVMAVALSLWVYLMPNTFVLKNVLTGFMYLAVTLMLWWASGKFAGSNRQCETMLPALWSEKALVVVVYSLIVVPLLLFVPQMLVDYVASLISGEPLTLLRLDDDSIIIFGKELGLSSCDTFFSITTCMFIACRSAKSTFLKSAVWSLLATIGFGLLVGIAFVAIFSTKVYTNAEALEGLNGSEVIDTLGIAGSMYIFYWISIAYSVLMVYLTVRSFKKIQM